MPGDLVVGPAFRAVPRRSAARLVNMIARYSARMWLSAFGNPALTSQTAAALAVSRNTSHRALAASNLRVDMRISHGEFAESGESPFSVFARNPIVIAQSGGNMFEPGNSLEALMQTAAKIRLFVPVLPCSARHKLYILTPEVP